MTITTRELSELILVVFFVYIYIELHIYLAIWAALYYSLRIAGDYLANDSGIVYKIVLSSYVILVLVGYLYKYRSVFVVKGTAEGPNAVFKLKNISTNKNKQRRVGIAVLLLIIINTVIVYLWQQ